MGMSDGQFPDPAGFLWFGKYLKLVVILSPFHEGIIFCEKRYGGSCQVSVMHTELNRKSAMHEDTVQVFR
jgi:hypothetical protein